MKPQKRREFMKSATVLGASMLGSAIVSGNPKPRRKQSPSISKKVVVAVVQSRPLRVSCLSRWVN